jgi:hypothetical protein
LLLRLLPAELSILKQRANFRKRLIRHTVRSHLVNARPLQRSRVIARQGRALT